MKPRKPRINWVKGGGHNKGQKAKPRAGTYGESKAEALERLAPLLRQVTESWARRAA